MNRGPVNPTSFVRWLVGAAGMTLLMALAFGGCSLERSGTIPQDCTADVQCDDQNPCTVDTCSEKGLCGHEPNDDIVLAQVAFDCKHAICEGGAPAEIPDPKDFDDDGESCTTDSCGPDGSKVTHEPLADGAGCKSGPNAGTCTDGKCLVECTLADADTKCDDGNLCTEDSCNLGTGYCQHLALDSVALDDSQQVVGNCKVKVCQQGKEEEIFDNTDLPNDDNPCTKDTCKEGTPSNEAQDINFACSKPGDDLAKVCDGNGTCVQCNQASQCGHLPADDECQKRTCSATGQCGQSFTANNTPLSAPLQTGGDCKKKFCDGTGKVKTLNDDTDLPNDNNECTKNVCTNGTPSNPAEAINTKCGTGGLLYCDGNKSCVGCNADGQCAADTPCQDNFCDGATKTCKANNGANGSVPPTLGQTTGDCQQVQCNGMGGTKSVASNTDVPADDGIQCTGETCVNGMPMHPPKDTGTSCNQDNGKVCDKDGACVECNDASKDCPAAADCKSPTCMAGKCGVANDAANSLCDAQTAGDCKSKLCDGNGACSLSSNVNDVGSDANDCTTDSCNAGTNVYTPVTFGQTVAGKCDNTVGCTTPPCVCDGAAAPNSACKSKTGTTCTNGATCASTFCADGVCCNAACGGGCDKCDANGACQANAIKSALDAGVCDATNKSESCDDPPCKCDAAGLCKGDLGSETANAANCLSGFSADGVCCDAACDGACAKCGTDGKCSATGVKNAQDPGTCDDTNGMCNGADKCTCDAGGACKAKLGEACTMGGQCASGFCADGVCCNAACDGGCDTCSTMGICGTNTITNAVDVGVCDGVATSESCQNPPCKCDAAGECKGDLGAVSNDGTKCVSTFSADGRCCDTACGGGCDKCGTDGICVANVVTSAVDPGSCDTMAMSDSCVDPPCKCDAAGVCKGDLGSSAMMAGQCLSGFLADGVCCDTACSATCEVCGMNGVCVAVAQNTADPNTCDAMNGNCGAGEACACGAAKACKRASGASCGMSNDLCASDSCMNMTCQ